MRYKVLFPEGRQNAFTFSYDDGQIYDRRLIEIMNQYHLKGTFHLNTGMIGTKTDADEFVSWEEVPELYRGHEIACHGYTHPWFTQLTKQQLVDEILEDKRALERAVGYPVRGMSYPFGLYSDEICNTAASLGIEYSRTVNAVHGFAIPNDFMKWHPSCHHNEAAEYLDSFLQPAGYMDLQLFYVWGHSFEFERDHTWSHIEDFCKRISGYEHVWYATNIEIKEYLCASKQLVVSVDGDMIYNPTSHPVWIQCGDHILTAEPGKQLLLDEGQ